MRPNKLTDHTFQSEVLQSSELVLVDFWAPWCKPCTMISPVIDQLAAEYDGKVKFGKLDVDENPETTQGFGILSIPTLMLFKNGQVVDKLIGLVPKQQLATRINSILEREVVKR